MAIAQDVGRRRGSTRGIVGTIPGTTIPGGIGTIRSTIPHGMVGVIPTIIPHGIRLYTMADHIDIMVADMLVVLPILMAATAGEQVLQDVTDVSLIITTQTRIT